MPFILKHFRIAPDTSLTSLRIDLRTARTARYHYDQHFGPVNSRTSIANHTFVMLDSPGLVEEDYIRDEHHTEYEHWTPLEGGAIEFVNSISQGLFLSPSHNISIDVTVTLGLTAEEHHPTILFSHIPLARPDTASCGPLREKGTIRRGVGAGYQNTLGKRTTNWIFRNIRPCIIFRFVSLVLVLTHHLFKHLIAVETIGITVIIITRPHRTSITKTLITPAFEKSLSNLSLLSSIFTAQDFTSSLSLHLICFLRILRPGPLQMRHATSRLIYPITSPSTFPSHLSPLWSSYFPIIGIVDTVVQGRLPGGVHYLRTTNPIVILQSRKIP